MWVWGPLVGHYLLQPLVAHFLVLDRPLPSRLVGLLLFFGSSYAVGRWIAAREPFHSSWGLVFVPHGAQGMKLTHLLCHSLFGASATPSFAREYGLTSFARTALFMCCVPTVVFRAVPHEAMNTRRRGLQVLQFASAPPPPFTKPRRGSRVFNFGEKLFEH